MTGSDARLLALAREALKAEVLPHLPAERRHAALMATTALGIAARRAEGAAARRAEALAALAPFVEGAEDLGEAQARLARRLRDEPARATPELHAALLAVTRAACAESNPKARALRGLPED